MRTSSAAALLLLLLAGCGEKLADKAKVAEVERAAQKRAEADGSIACQLKGMAAFQRSCTIDRVTTQDGLFLTVRHPDGEFHRLKVVEDGRGVVAADGAEQAVVSILDGQRIEVALAGARYQLPATVGPVRRP